MTDEDRMWSAKLTAATLLQATMVQLQGQVDKAFARDFLRSLASVSVATLSYALDGGETAAILDECKPMAAEMYEQGCKGVADMVHETAVGEA